MRNLLKNANFIIKALKLAHEIGLNNDIIHAVYVYITNTIKESDVKKLITEINQLSFD